jgi:2-amino-4-hydroxy-6-hydroxymethyldihydropteridine diphosphokinase
MAAPRQSVHTAFIALGSNLGNRRAHLDAAVQALAGLGRVSRVSSFYDTEPVGHVAQPDFLNAVAELQTTLPPQELLAALLWIEQQHGRDRGSAPPKGPRTLDLDLLSYDAMALDTPSLTLPHPALAERGFVLQPLAEIAPYWRHPVSGKLVSQLLAELPGPKNPRQH